MTPEQVCQALGSRVPAWCSSHAPSTSSRSLPGGWEEGMPDTKTWLLTWTCPPAVSLLTCQTAPLAQRPGIGSESEEKDPRACLLAHFTGRKAGE